MIGIIFLSFIAGVLTILAPCVFPLLPAIVGSSAVDNKKYRPYVVTASLAISIVIFTILLKFGSGVLNIPEEFWQYASGTILIVFGVVTIFPKLWDTISLKLQLSRRSDETLHKTGKYSGWQNAVLTGAALGPVFTSCSPTYFAILGLTLTGSYGEALFYLVFFVLGLATIMLPIGIFGQSISKKLKWAADPHGKFKKFIGVLFILVGLMVMFNLQKDFQETVLELPFFESLIKFEDGLLEKTDLLE